MRSIKLAEIAGVTGGEVSGRASVAVKGVSIDSRSLGPGELFVALKGERQDGHEFLEKALRAGAAAALVARGNPLVARFREENPGLPLVIVEEPLKALGDLAACVREELDVEVVGITGSTGKTCTKDFLVSVMNRKFATACSAGSFNNEIGVPLTVFGVNGRHRVLVTEMGARRPGDIERLAGIVRPGAGIITNIGVTHLEVFGSRERLADTKAELARAIPAGGFLVLNADCEWFGWLRRQAGAQVVKFGTRRGADYSYSGVTLDREGRPSFRLRGPDFDVRLRLQAVGAHQAANAAAAAACAHRFGIGPGDIVAGLEEADPSGWRLEVLKARGGFTVINDAYNASPHSMKAALETLEALGREKRTVAVLGGMEELGEASGEYHLEAGALFARLGLDILVTVGKRAADYGSAAMEAGLPAGSTFRCRDVAGALSVLSDILETGDVVLVKASRVARLERVAEAITTGAFGTAGGGEEDV